MLANVPFIVATNSQKHKLVYRKSAARSFTTLFELICNEPMDERPICDFLQASTNIPNKYLCYAEFW